MSRSYIQTAINNCGYKSGDSVIAFDNKDWAQIGDIGDNSQFYKEAKIINVRWHEPVVYGSSGLVADIQWKHNGESSSGHFIIGLKHLK